MITADYLRTLGALVDHSNPAMHSVVQTRQPRSHRVVQWKAILSRRAGIALDSLGSEDRRIVETIIEQVKKIPTVDSLPPGAFRMIAHRGFSVLLTRHDTEVEITDILSKDIVDEFGDQKNNSSR